MRDEDRDDLIDLGSATELTQGTPFLNKKEAVVIEDHRDAA